MELTRLMYDILSILKEDNYVDQFHSLTIYELQEMIKKYKPNTIYKSIRSMENLKLIQKGVKAERAVTYYITEKGLDLIK